jgi:ATP synthase protein I
MFLAFRAAAFQASLRTDGSERVMAEDETGQDPHSPPDARLTSLEQRLKRAEQAEVERRPADSTKAIRSAGWMVAQNLIGMPLGGALVGFVLDKLFGTLPWIMLALMFIGFAGAVWGLMKKQGSDRS